jgi:hypothetical protein
MLLPTITLKKKFDPTPASKLTPQISLRCELPKSDALRKHLIHVAQRPK